MFDLVLLDLSVQIDQVAGDQKWVMVPTTTMGTHIIHMGWALMDLLKLSSILNGFHKDALSESHSCVRACVRACAR